MGQNRALSSSRALVLDTLHFAASVPAFPVEQTFDLSNLAALRQQASVRISWAVLFLKAYGIVSAERSVLRDVFAPWPWPHVYQSDTSVATLAIHRRHENDDRLCWGRFPQPETTPLVDLQRRLDRYQQLPVDQVFRRQLRFSRLPTWLRRLAWRTGLYINLARRAQRFGTYSVSSLAGEQTLNRFHPTIHTTSLTYGPLDSAGRCLVTLLCDHRILDGMAAGQALTRLQAALRNQIASELATLSTHRAAA